jgi:hypothetical protein
MNSRTLSPSRRPVVEAIVLDLVDPIGTGGRLGGEARDQGGMYPSGRASLFGCQNFLLLSRLLSRSFSVTLIFLLSSGAG